MPVMLLGIRHHGPGSCRHVMAYLEELQPDLILLEAPSDITPLLDFVPTKSEAAAHPLEEFYELKAKAKKKKKQGKKGKGKGKHKQLEQEQPELQEQPEPVAATVEMLRPPVALMAYQSDQPHNSVSYPFVEFSPEWQTLLYAKEHGIEVRPFDLPLSYLLADRAKEIEKTQAALEAAVEALEEEAADDVDYDDDIEAEAKDDTDDANASESEPKSESTNSSARPVTTASADADANADTDEAAHASASEGASDDNTAEVSAEIEHAMGDPFDYLAQVEGLSDGEQWWESRIEQRISSQDIFQAVELAVTAIREELPAEATSSQDLVREAWMRKELRAAIKDANAIAAAREAAKAAAAEAEATVAAVDGTASSAEVTPAAAASAAAASAPRREGLIVVVCGAWHVPALRNLERYKIKDDQALIKSQAKPFPPSKVGLTWIPWSYSRLSVFSGYGAGITSPGWNHYSFMHPEDDGTIWLTQVANILRKEGHEISVAHVSEAVVLARALIAIRGLTRPSLSELNEAVVTVMGNGDNNILQLIAPKLMIADRLGTVPSNVPMVPLLADITLQQKRLRQSFVVGNKMVNIDLRKPLGLARSVFFNRLRLLDITWAQEQEVNRRGTFKEKWLLNYTPEQVLVIIERATFGNTLLTAVQNYVHSKIEEKPKLDFITKTLNKVIRCDMPQLVTLLNRLLNDLAATESDLHVLMKTVPELCSILRYGDVRNFDLSTVRDLLEIMLERIHAGIVLLCSSIKYEAARDIKKLLQRLTLAVNTLNDKGCMQEWQQTLLLVHREDMVHPLLAGCATRLLREFRDVDHGLILESLRYYTSEGNDPDDIAFWFEGFFENSGTLLLLDAELWGMVNSFVSQLDDESFEHILPIMRRTVSSFTAHERTQLGSKAKDFYLAAGSENPLQAGASSPAAEQGAEAAAAMQTESPEEQAAQPLIALVSSFFGKNWG